jgi:hypothetical protein
MLIHYQTSLSIQLKFILDFSIVNQLNKKNQFYLFMSRFIESNPIKAFILLFVNIQCKIIVEFCKKSHEITV